MSSLQALWIPHPQYFNLIESNSILSLIANCKTYNLAN